MANHRDTRAALLAAAAGEFAERGYHGAGVDRIAASAEVNKRMIYHHFADKAGLMRAVMMERLGNWSGEPLEPQDAQLLLAEAEYLRDGGELVDADGRNARLAAAFGDVHDGVKLARLGVQLLPGLLPQLMQLLDVRDVPPDLADQVERALRRASEKRKVTLRAATRED